jgi:hypothetical protein
MVTIGASKEQCLSPEWNTYSPIIGQCP